MTRVIDSVSDMQKLRSTLSGRIGFVPTMGALHRGHEQLLQKARAENEIVILSIFVNKTQFNDPNDFAKYPKTWEQDLAMAEKNQVDFLFFPRFEQMYPDQYRYRVIENDFSEKLCGKDRPGHFDGVLSVVMKLLNLTRPTRAYFGEKDYQQLSLIKGMVASFFLETEIIPVPTVREKDGLAMSSRNVRLTSEQRELAPLIYKAISQCASDQEAAKFLTEKGFQVDYVQDVNERRFVAARLGEVRLIDNVQI